MTCKQNLSSSFFSGQGLYMGSKQNRVGFILNQAVILSVFFCGACSSNAPVPLPQKKSVSPKEIFQKNSSSVPVIHSYVEDRHTGNGSSFVANYNSRNYLITNYHVITAGYFAVVHNGKIIKNYSVLRANDIEDIAVLTFPGIENISGILISEYEPSEGEGAFAMGYPVITTSEQASLTIAEGLVSNSRLIFNRGEIGTKRYIQLSVPVNPGNSGGPIFNDQGSLIGMTTLKWINLSSVSAAIPNADIIREIKAAVPDTESLKKEEAKTGIMKRISLIAVSLNELDVLEFGYHYSPSVKLGIHGEVKESAERIRAAVTAAGEKYPNDREQYNRFLSEALSPSDYLFFLMTMRYFQEHREANLDSVLGSPFLASQLYLAGRFYFLFTKMADAPAGDIVLKKYTVTKVKFNKGRTKALVEMDVETASKTFPAKLEFIREWGNWFLLPTYSL